jgi:hypothetical protein
MGINSVQPQLPTVNIPGDSDATLQARVPAPSSNWSPASNGGQNPTAQSSQFPQFGPPPPPREWNIASAVMHGIDNLCNAVTTIFPKPEPKPIPRPLPMPLPFPVPLPIPKPKPPVVIDVPGKPDPVIIPEVDVPKVPVTPPAPQPPASLIPPWAKMFEHTGKSEWRSGGTGQKAYIDLRPELDGKIEKIEVLSPDGTTVIATGTYEKTGKDGRPRFKFSKSGNDLPEGAILKAVLKPNKNGDPGGIRYIEIPNPSKKFVF